jgi:broad specificity phosphatase PhoE
MPAYPPPTDLVIIRHGETVWNSQGRWQGWLDSPLTELGVAQARAAGEDLRGEDFSTVYSSDAGRAIETARLICAGRGLEPVSDKALRERFYGEYEGLNSKEIQERLPGTRFKAGVDSREDWRPPGGETMREVRDRVAPFLRAVVHRHAGQRVLLVTHSGVVRTVDSIVRGLAFDEIWHRVPPNACVFVVRAMADGGWQIVRDFLPTPD